MTFEPIETASFAIQFHIVCAVLGIFLGPIAIYRKTRDRLHKLAGYLWVSAMAGLATSGLFIHSLPVIGPFGPIHLFSLMAYWSLFFGMQAIYRKDIKKHRSHMEGLYFQGLGLAGLFAFLPGRTLNEVLFGQFSIAGFVGLAALVFGGLVLRWVLKRRAPHPA